MRYKIILFCIYNYYFFPTSPLLNKQVKNINLFIFYFTYNYLLTNGYINIYYINRKRYGYNNILKNNLYGPRNFK